MADLFLLGKVDLHGSDGQEAYSVLVQPKRLAVLVYLALATPRGLHRRDELLALFWPHLDNNHARNALSKALHVLRRGLGNDVLITRGDTEIGVSDLLRVDVHQFERALVEARCADALDLYRGDLLPCFAAPDVAPELESWLEDERRRLRGMAAEAARRLGEDAAARNDHAAALRWYRRTSVLSPHDEGIVVSMLGLMDSMGDRAGALDLYGEFRRRLAVELELEPSAQAEMVMARIRASDREGAAAAPVSTPEPVAADAQHPAYTEPTNRASASRPPLFFRESRRSPFPGMWLAVTVLAVAVAVGVVAARSWRPNGSLAKGVIDSPNQITYSGNAILPSLSADGQFLAFGAVEGDSIRVVIHDVRGGEQDTASVSFVRISTLQWSPDGSDLVIGGTTAEKGDGVYLLPRLSGRARLLGTVSRAVKGQPQAYWIPGERRVSVHTPSSKRVLLIDPLTGDSTSLAVGGEYTWMFTGHWSPDGRLFAVVTQSSEPLRYTLRVVDRQGRMGVMVEDSVWLGTPHWSAAGDLIYYGRRQAIWQVGVAPSTGRRLSDPEEAQVDHQVAPFRFSGLAGFSMSPEGRWISYAVELSHSNLWRIEADWSASAVHGAPLTRGTAMRWWPVVSPDGEWIAYLEATGEQAEIFRVSAKGGRAEQVTLGAKVRVGAQIAWSPEGNEIAFLSVRGGNARVWIASVADGHLRALQQSRPGMAQAHLTWAPGREIAYHSAAHDNIRLVDPETGQERTLVPEEAPGFLMSPRYSPDGRTLAVAWNHGPDLEKGIWVFPMDGSPATRIHDRWLWPMGWSADGRYVFGHNNAGPAIFRIDTTGLESAPRQVSLTQQFPTFAGATCAVGGDAWFVCAVSQSTSDVYLLQRSAVK